MPDQVPYFRHDQGQAELDAVAEVLAGPMLTTGETVARFERRFADYLGCKHALGVTSCTGALHLSLLALGIGPGDEVLTTPMTFIATATAILEAGATPVFVDVEPDTGLLDPARLEAALTARTRAILPVHLYGQMCDMRAIRRIADEHRLHVIEDAAHCVEGIRDGVRPGQLGDTACFSFYATKNMTCGEGGAVTTHSDLLSEKLRLLRLHGMTKSAADRAREGYRHWDMTVLGWKYNMDNIQAALLLPQMDRLEANWRKRHELATYYTDCLMGLPGLRLPSKWPGSQHAHHCYPMWIEGGRRDEIVDGLHRSGVGVVVNYRAIHLLTYFRETFGFLPGDFPNAEKIGDSTISLPFYPNMPREQARQVVEALRRLLGAGRMAAQARLLQPDRASGRACRRGAVA
jgi:UDP-4-amino-4-deoxy-L-arabinose-oxoglutarate aminotransferase